jgi:hypothetical protein
VTPNVLFLVLDGLSPRHIDRATMPVLTSLAESGGWCRQGGIGVMPTSTYPNHATFVTGVAPARHGVVANEIPTEAGPLPSWERGPSVPTLFDAVRAGGGSSAAVFGDHNLVGVTAADRADQVWPGAGRSEGLARDILGYAKDRETSAGIVATIDAGPDLIVAQFNESDTDAHIFGPDSPEALRRYGRSDAYLETVLDALRSAWDEWAVIVVSDHSQESVTDPEPIDLRAAARSRGLAGVVIDDGAGAAVGGEMARQPAWLTEVEGVEGIHRLDLGAVFAWGGPGRYFSSEEVPVRGVHGSPRTAGQVAVVGGGHPEAEALAAQISRRQPTGTSWAPAVAALLGVPLLPA